jgi:hypothetical protein
LNLEPKTFEPLTQNLEPITLALKYDE